MKCSVGLCKEGKELQQELQLCINQHTRKTLPQAASFGEEFWGEAQLFLYISRMALTIQYAGLPILSLSS